MNDGAVQRAAANTRPDGAQQAGAEARLDAAEDAPAAKTRLSTAEAQQAAAEMRPSAAGTQQAAADRIIVALDCSENEAYALAASLKGKARWLKVGMTLYYAAGPRIVAALKEQGFKVFVDLKLHDIPHQVRGAAASIVRAGADLLTVHAAGGLAMMQAAVEGAREAQTGEASKAGQGTSPSVPPSAKPLVVAVTVLTSMDADALAQTGVTRPLDEQVAQLAQLAQEAGLDGVVASPQEAQTLRALLGPNAAIVTPGVRPKGAAIGDQSRVATPAEAIAAGASHLVIGRPITAAPNPAAAFDAIATELEREDA
jgi:orotidine-5'-phosphate decarboxylase